MSAQLLRDHTRARIQASIAEHAQELEQSTAAPLDEIRRLQGRMGGLRLAEELMAEVMREIHGG